LKQLFQNAWNHREWLALDLTLLALCAVAAFHGIRATGDLNWPYDVDQYREMGLAQTILDHQYGADHLYRGESIWYNPLVSIIIAAVSRLTHLPLALVTARLGPYLNLIAPIAFYVLVAYLFGRWIAIAATAAFLFAPIGNAVSWAAATYSPWIFGENFTQALFYFTLAAHFKALETKNWRWYFATGILLGLTFLGATAPAVILGVIMIVVCTKGVVAQPRDRAKSVFSNTEIRGLGLIVLLAFIVSWPFTFSILGRYHLKIVNLAPTNWMYEPLQPANFGAFLWSGFSWFSAIAVVGFFALFIKPSRPHTRILLLTWLGICCLELALNFIQQVMSPPRHFMFVSAHHFLFYFRAGEDILFGLGLVVLCRWIAQWINSKFSGSTSRDSFLRQRLEGALIALCIVLFVICVFPGYRFRLDFTGARAVSLYFQRDQKDRLDGYRWILSNTRPDDIFLSIAGDLDLRVVAPAGRKVIVTSWAEFSNPYVALRPRLEAAAIMTRQLELGSPDALETLNNYNVTYVIVPSAIASQIEGRSLFLLRKFAEGQVTIYKVIGR
jgi:hypothetical protein